MDSRIWILVAFWLVVGLTNGTMQYVAKNAEKIKGLKGSAGCLVAILVFLFIPVIYITGGWADMIVWNMIAPQFNMPQIDLITAVGVSFLLQSLIKGTGPLTVRVMKPDIGA